MNAQISNKILSKSEQGLKVLCSRCLAWVSAQVSPTGVSMVVQPAAARSNMVVQLAAATGCKGGVPSTCDAQQLL